MTTRRLAAAAALAVLALVMLPACGLVENAEAIAEHLEGESRGALPDEPPADLTARADLAVGDCIDDYGYDEWDTITGFSVVDCEENHYEELYALAEHPGDDYPGDNRVWKTGEVGCIEAFEGYVGAPYEESAYGMNWLTPTPEEWRSGSRSTLCLLWDYDYLELTGSARGSGR